MPKLHVQAGEGGLQLFAHVGIAHVLMRGGSSGAPGQVRDGGALRVPTVQGSCMRWRRMAATDPVMLSAASAHRVGVAHGSIGAPDPVMMMRKHCKVPTVGEACAC